MPTTSSGLDGFPPVPFTGRREQLDRLVALLQRAGGRSAQAVFLTGEAGVGKTRLARQFGDHARRHGFRVASGRAFAVESGLPYAVFADAMLPILRGFDAAALNVLTRGAGGDLAGILPTLFTVAPDAIRSDAAEAKTRMFWSFTELLIRLAARQPLLLLLDNLQWADPSSLELLHFVVRQVHASSTGVPLMIVGTRAELAGHARDGARMIEQSLVTLAAASVEQIAPLTLPEVSALIRQMFGEPEHGTRDFVVALHQWTGGNPFFVEELLTSLAESGQLRRASGRWTGWNIDSFVPPHSVRDVVLDRSALLGAPARALLDLAATLGTRVTLETLVALGDMSADVLADALDELLHTGFLVVGADQDAVSYDFAHPLVRDTLYSALGPVRAQGMHDRIAVALEQLYVADPLAHASELAHHFTRGRPGVAGDRATPYLIAAGRQALARRADQAAMEYLEPALARLDRQPPASAGQDASDTVALLAHARERTGNHTGAAELWHRVRAEALARRDSTGVAAVERRLGLMAASAGEPSAALVHFEAALSALGDPAVDRALEIRLRLARATTLQSIGRRAEALTDVGAALMAAESLGDDGLLARVHRAMMLLHVWTGPAHEARSHGSRAVKFAVASGERSVEWSAHWAMAIHGGLTGAAEATAHHVREARRLADEVRSPVLRLWTSDVEIEYLAGIGHWREALAIADRAIPAARALMQHTLLARLLVWTGLIHRGLGDLRRARELIEEAWRLTGAGRDEGGVAADVHALVPAYTGMAGYLMTAGDNAGALAIGEAGLAIADRTGYVAWAIYRLLPFVIETALYLEDYERAARHNARLRRDSLALGHALGIAWADTTDALLVYLTGDAARAVPMLRAATAALEQVPFVFDAAKLRRLVARALFDAGNVAGATSELRLAYEIFSRLGAERELRITRDQLRAMGARVPGAARGVDTALALSAREGEIARLVAARKSNKEIGAALDISARTVSTHLSNVFHKLGVASRGELTDLVRGGRLEIAEE